MARVDDLLLDEAFAATEGGECLPGRGRVGGLEVVSACAGAEAAAAAAVDGLDDDGVADALGDLGAFGEIGDGAGAGCDRGGDRLGDLTGTGLVAEEFDGSRGRPDPGEPGVDDGLGEEGVLGEVAVAGVDGVGPGALGKGEDLVDVEVGLPSAGALEQPGVIGERDELGVRIGSGVDGDRLESQIVGRPDDAQGDLTAIGDEDAAHWGRGDVRGQRCGRLVGEDCGHGAPFV